MRSSGVAAAVLAGLCAISSAPAIAQDGGQAAEPAPSSELPPVEVIQKQAAPSAPEQSTPQQSVVSPTPQGPPPQQQAAPPADSNPIYGARNSGAAAARAANGATSPINPTSIVPSNLENYTGSATIVTQETLEEDRPRTNNEVFTRVPGVIVVNDDGSGHHGGIGIRGSAPRRGRKLLMMEDGHANNLALWLDPSVHFTYPIERIESFEVIRGTTIVHGPNNNFGVINARNLSPFGPNETVISSDFGWTRSDGGCFEDEDGDTSCKSGSTDNSYRWHVHTRQMAENVGVVLSYTGADIQGSWDSEKLRFNDYYGAIGWKGIDQDLTVSLSHTRQRDLYDESNLEGEDEDELGEVETNFLGVKHCKTCFAPGAIFNNYNGEIWRGQIVHNNYVDDNTTVTTRVYAQEHRRDRYQIVTLEDNPVEAEDTGIGAVFDGDEVIVPEDSMFGRLRTFRHLGAETRAEFANLPLMGAMTQTIQTGIRYEYQDMTNRNFIGASGQILEDGDEDGLTIFERNLRANTASAFVQTDIKAASDFHVVPGVRFEWYRIKRNSLVTSEEEGEAEEHDDADAGDTLCDDAIGEDECYVIEGISRRKFQESTSSFNVLPGISYSYTGFYRTTLFGGYHRGMSTGVLRNEDFPTADEIGDNFQIGLRTKAIPGLDFQVVGFYQFLHDFQYGATFTTAEDKTYGRADEVEIRGVELYGRLDSKPIVGGPLNFFSEANYSYTNGVFKKGVVAREDEDTGVTENVSLTGNRLPEVPFNLAALSVGVEDHKAVWPWNASITWTYRGEFYTDEFNTPYGGNAEGEVGLVPSVWLLSARFNLDIGDTGASMYVAGTNLLDEFYITDREDGLKPGIGRTIWTGFKYKF